MLKISRILKDHELPLFRVTPFRIIFPRILLLQSKTLALCQFFLDLFFLITIFHVMTIHDRLHSTDGVYTCVFPNRKFASSAHKFLIASFHASRTTRMLLVPSRMFSPLTESFAVASGVSKILLVVLFARRTLLDASSLSAKSISSLCSLVDAPSLSCRSSQSPRVRSAYR